MGLSIRRARLEDSDAILALHWASWRAAYVDIFPPDTPAALTPEGRSEIWRRVLREPARYPDERVFVADLEGAIVGLLAVRSSREPDLPGYGELHTMYVAPDRWRQGIGRPLLEAALDFLRDEGYRDAYLWALEDNARARAFYERLGWRYDGTRKPLPEGGTPVVEVRYRRSLVAEHAAPGD